jgi:hypothetical protein
LALIVRALCYPYIVYCGLRATGTRPPTHGGGPRLREHRASLRLHDRATGPHSNARAATDGWRGGAAYFFSLVVVVVVDVDAAAGGGAVVVVVVDEVVVGSDGLTSELPPPHATPTADTAARTTRPITFFILSPPRTAFWTHSAASVKQKRDSAWMLVHDASQVRDDVGEKLADKHSRGRRRIRT